MSPTSVLFRVRFLLPALWVAGGGLMAVEAGPSTTIRVPQSVFVLSGSAIGSWTQVSGPARARVLNPSAKDLYGIVRVPGTYVFKLSVGNESSTTQVTLEANAWQPSDASTAEDYVKNGPRPIFRDGHHMMPLSDMFQIGEKLAISLSDYFGYGLTIGLTPTDANASLDLTSGDHSAQMMRAAIASGGKRKLVLTYGRVLPGGNVDENDFLATAPAAAWMHDAGGNMVMHDDGGPLLSPAAPDDWIRSLAVPLGNDARLISQAYPVSLIMSGGEYGIVGYDTLGKYLTDDPAIRSILGGSTDDGDYYTYTARRRAEMERLIQDEIAGKGTVFAGDRTQGLYSDSYSSERGRWNGWLSYNYPFEESRKTNPPVSSVAMPEIYFNHVTNSGFGGMYSYELDGIKLPSDIATHLLNDIGGGYETTGVKTFYGWISAGWQDTGIAERERWMGFTKVLCTLGMVGGITGYFMVDDDFLRGHIRDGFVGKNQPSWLWQMTDLGHAIALFSHFEDFIRDGSLVAGTKLHPYRANGYLQDYDSGIKSKKLYALDLDPSEYTQIGEPKSFVVGRRHADGMRWILTAWCMVGAERDVTASLPGYGNVTLRARPSGSVYLLDKRGAQPILRLVDPDGMNPSALLFPVGDALEGQDIPLDATASAQPSPASDESSKCGMGLFGYGLIMLFMSLARRFHADRSDADRTV